MMTRQCCCGMRSCTFACGMYAGVDDPTAPTARVPTLQCCVCGSSASNQCAKCKQPAYCGRKCQRKHWTAHKTVCGSKTAKVAAIACARPSMQSLTLVLLLSIALHCIVLLLFSLWQIVSRSAFESLCARNGVDAVRACIAAGQNIHAINVRICQQCVSQLREPVESGVFLL